MAVTIPATGSGTATPVVATDDAGASGHVQIAKLAISTAGSATLLPGDAANGLDVDVTRVSGTVTVNGSGVTQPVSDAGGSLSVDDNGGSLTVDSAQLPAALVSGRLDVNVGATSIPAVVTIEAAYTAAQTDTAIITVAAPNRIVVTRVLVACDNANTVDVGLRIGFGTINTPTTTGVVASHPGIPPGGGFNSGDGSGVLGIGASDEDLRITSEVPTTGSLRVVVSYYLTT